MLDAVQNAFLRFHQGVYQATGGRIGHGMIGVPTLLLYTTGSKTGQRRTSALVYATEDDDYLVVASNGGSDRPPAWLGNLRATPSVEVQVRDRVRPATARIVESTDADYQHLWGVVNENNHGRYERYQRKTTRLIPVVRLTPTRPRAT